MFKTPASLKFVDLADFRLLPKQDYSFLRSELVSLIVIDEIADVAHQYSITVRVGSALLVALMGVQKESNAYVSPSGSWLTEYIPAHKRV
ncbi:SapC family protein [Roseicyclus mahoneyensis]|jgi:hypothetical protein|uniref:SapC protein n=1 Tax=Roseicyclus mahoneyensis TaxID=164332 RepID=A0A316G1T4_9RHOB|nr:SapC family protein [Roseicyclus mahoneyensis]PWK54904.1 SapC protein [Roseicyclus mahoneyensis]